MTSDGKISIMIIPKLHFEYLRKENSTMNAIKMGMTIEEAAETSGIGRNQRHRQKHNAKVGGLGQAACSEGRT